MNVVDLKNFDEVSRSTMMLPFHAFAKDKDGCYLFCNFIMAEDLGLSGPSEIIGRTDKELIWKSFAGGLQEHDQYVIAKQEDYDFVEPVRLLTKQSVDLISHKYPFICSADDKIDGVFGVSFVKSYCDKFNHLSNQQEQVVILTTQGLSAKEIAKVLHISYRTVEEYLEKARIRLGCRNKAQLVATYIKETFGLNVISELS